MSDKANIELPEDAVVVSVATVVGGKVRGETIHIEHCYDGFAEVSYKAEQFVVGAMEAGDRMKVQAVADVMNGEAPPWKQ